MKKVLIITYYWPPSGGAGVQRWLKFVKYLPQLGYEPHVYTPSNPEAPAQDASLQKDVPKEAIIIKRPILEPYSFYKKFTGKKGNVNAGFLSEDKDSRQKFTEKLSIWIRGNLFIPDARVFWVRPSVKFLKSYIQENNIDIVVSSGPPHSMHLIAMQLQQQLGIKWIADFRDPWTNIDFYKDLMLSKWADKKHHRLEKEVLQKADEVITIGKTIAQELEEIRGKKVAVITNGFDNDDFTTAAQKDDNSFSIIHIGSINSDRNHKIFWSGIRELVDENEDFAKKLKLKFIGKLDYSVIEDLESFQLKDRTEIISYIPHNEAVNNLSAADLLYLPLNNTPNAKGILSGKFFEYLAVGKPILGIGHPNGDAAEIMKETLAGAIINFEEEVKLKEFILEQFHQAQNNTNADLQSRMKYSRKSLTEDLVRLF